MKIAFDTNVLLDVLCDRDPFAEPASRILALVEAGILQGCVCATSVTTIFYLARKTSGLANARRQVQLLLSLLEVLPVNRQVLEAATNSQFTDFEDAVVAEAAHQGKADVIVTRNEKDFKKSRVQVHSPQALLTAIETLE
ncbi:MAG: PIN domain-containing protein [Bythopirellula sp.]|nr:PIN domain-containing protein [Bythopirellula sp.]